MQTDEFAKFGESECLISNHALYKGIFIDNDNSINYIDITSYNTKRIIKCELLSDYMKKLQEQASEYNKNITIHDNVNYSLLEVLSCNTVRMYFDIENIPRDNKEMIYEIIDKIYEIMQLKNKVSSEDYEKYRKYALTFNNNSQYLSQHGDEFCNLLINDIYIHYKNHADFYSSL